MEVAMFHTNRNPTVDSDLSRMSLKGCNTWRLEVLTSQEPVPTDDPIRLSPPWSFRAAMILAMAADALQIFVFPLFVECAL